jgi:nicotinamidase-related amidase
VIHVRNNGGPEDPDFPGTPGWELATEVLAGEQVVDKHETDSFAGTQLAELMPAGAEIVLVGMQSEYCIRDTALAARQRGYSVSVVRGAHATYDDERTAAETKQAVEQELEGAGVLVLDATDVRFF